MTVKTRSVQGVSIKGKWGTILSGRRLGSRMVRGPGVINIHGVIVHCGLALSRMNVHLEVPSK